MTRDEIIEIIKDAISKCQIRAIDTIDEINTREANAVMTALDRVGVKIVHVPKGYSYIFVKTKDLNGVYSSIVESCPGATKKEEG